MMPRAGLFVHVYATFHRQWHLGRTDASDLTHEE